MYVTNTAGKHIVRVKCVHVVRDLKVRETNKRAVKIQKGFAQEIGRAHV